MNECQKNKRSRAQVGWLVILLRLYICSSKEMETRRMGRQKKKKILYRESCEEYYFAPWQLLRKKAFHSWPA